MSASFSLHGTLGTPKPLQACCARFLPGLPHVFAPRWLKPGKGGGRHGLCMVRHCLCDGGLRSRSQAAWMGRGSVTGQELS